MINKLVILAGGRGTRFLEETNLIPKPMINIGPFPIILHIMKYYNYYGINEFIVCGGYKVDIIKNFFVNFNNFLSDIEIDTFSNEIKLLSKKKLNWNIKIIDTGSKTMTGGRLKRIKKYINENENFHFTYGDGLSNININNLIKSHNKSKKIATVTSVLLQSKYGVIKSNKNNVINFREKPSEKNNFINGGYFVLNYKIFDYIKNNQSIFEESVIQKLVKSNQLNTYKHLGFWKSMDSLKDKLDLEDIWKKNPPWVL